MRQIKPFIYMFLLICVYSCKAHKSVPDATHRVDKGAVADSINHAQAVDAIEKGEFIILFTQIVNSKGETIPVGSTAHYLSVKDNDFCIRGTDPENINGGFYRYGTIRRYNVKTDKKANITISFETKDTDISIQMNSRSNKASITIRISMPDDHASYEGILLPYDESKIQIMPRYK